MEFVATEIAVACATRIATSTDNGHGFVHVTRVMEACTHDRFIDFSIVEFNRGLIKAIAIASRRDIPQVIAAGLMLELRIQHIVVIARLARMDSTGMVASEAARASRSALAIPFIIEEILSGLRHRDSLVIL